MIFAYFYFNFSLGSACSHLAGLLFKLEACVRLQLNKKSVTSQLCQWSRCRKHAEPALLQEINFKLPRKGQLPEEPTTTQNRVQHFSVRSAVGIPAEKLELRELSSNAAIFTSLPSSERHKPASGYDIVTAEENEDSLLPEPLTSLFDYNAINMEGVLLQEFAVKKFSDYESCFSQDLYDRLTAITISQSLSNVWRLHRVGRITASNFYDVIHCKSGKSKTLLNKLMNYVAVPPNLPSLVYGREMEAVAKKVTLTWLKNTMKT